MKKIELSQIEKDAIKQHLNGGIGFDAPLEIVEAMNSVIDKADALQAEIDPEMEGQFAEPNCDLISWFMKQYEAQEAQDQG